MIFVIVPLGKEASHIANWVWRVIMYTAATTVGAALLALVLGAAGRALHILLPAVAYQWVVALFGVLALVFALKELNIIKLPSWQVGWQVPASWMHPSRTFGNTLYGIVLGTGIFTYIPFASFYLLLMWEMAAGAVSLQAAVLLGLIYGFARGVPAVVGGISILRGSYPLPVSEWLIERLGWWHAINGLLLLVIGGFLLASFVL
jgi:hypothetical protein